MHACHISFSAVWLSIAVTLQVIYDVEQLTSITGAAGVSDTSDSSLHYTKK